MIHEALRGPFVLLLNAVCINASHNYRINTVELSYVISAYANFPSRRLKLPSAEFPKVMFSLRPSNQGSLSCSHTGGKQAYGFLRFDTQEKQFEKIMFKKLQIFHYFCMGKPGT